MSGKHKIKKSINSSLLSALPENAQGYVDLPFFKSWLVGFSISEVSFFVKKNLDACFELRQRSHPSLFLAFKILFKT